MISFVSFLIVAALLALVNGNVETDECIVSKGNKCDLSSFSKPTLVFPGGDARCAFDDSDHPSAGLKTNSTYYFQVFPGKKKKNVLLYFQGGGGCMNPMQCSYLAQCLKPNELFRNSVRPDFDGVFDTKNPRNPYKDWTIVHVTYCTGDLHMGNYVRNPFVLPKAKSSDSSKKENPLKAFGDIRSKLKCMAQGANMKTHHVGAKNTKAVLDWMYQNIPKPKKLVISGCSAGALAAQLYSSSIIKKYKEVNRKLLATVVLDSYVGAAPIPNAAGLLLKEFKACSLNLGMSSELTQKCNSRTLNSVELVKYFISQNKDVPFAFVNSKNDKIQRKFYGLFKNGIEGLTSPPISGVQFYKEMNAIISEYAKGNSNVVAYMVDGDEHCFSPYKRLFTTVVKTNRKEKSLVRWMKNLVKRKRKIKSVCAGPETEGNSTAQLATSCPSYIKGLVFIRSKLQSSYSSKPDDISTKNPANSGLSDDDLNASSRGNMSNEDEENVSSNDSDNIPQNKKPNLRC